MAIGNSVGSTASSNTLALATQSTHTLEANSQRSNGTPRSRLNSQTSRSKASPGSEPLTPRKKRTGQDQAYPCAMAFCLDDEYNGQLSWTSDNWMSYDTLHSIMFSISGYDPYDDVLEYWVYVRWGKAVDYVSQYIDGDEGVQGMLEAFSEGRLDKNDDGRVIIEYVLIDTFPEYLLRYELTDLTATSTERREVPVLV